LVFLEGAGDIVLDQDVRCLGEFVEDLDAFGFLKREADGFLVAIHADEVGTFSGATAFGNGYDNVVLVNEVRIRGIFAVLTTLFVLRERRTPCSSVIATGRMFDLDHFSSAKRGLASVVVELGRTNKLVAKPVQGKSCCVPTPGRPESAYSMATLQSAQNVCMEKSA
jgi:hypothetical protein